MKANTKAKIVFDTVIQYEQHIEMAKNQSAFSKVVDIEFAFSQRKRGPMGAFTCGSVKKGI